MRNLSEPLAARTTEGPAPRVSARQIELLISYALRVGVIISAAFITTGLTLFVFGRHSDAAPPTLHALLHTQPSAVGLGDIVHRAVHLHPVGLIELGIFLLILTPVVRVAMTVALFAVDGDPTFLVVVCIVLAVLILGLTGLV